MLARSDARVPQDTTDPSGNTSSGMTSRRPRTRNVDMSAIETYIDSQPTESRILSLI
jgi:hypothetical protein